MSIQFRASRLVATALLAGLVSLTFAGCSSGSDSASNSGTVPSTTEQDPFAVEDYQKGFNWGQQAGANNPFRQSGQDRCNDLWFRATGKETVDARVWMNGCLDGFAGSVGGGGSSSSDSGFIPSGGGIETPDPNDPKVLFANGFETGKGWAWERWPFTAKAACTDETNGIDDPSWVKGCEKAFAEERNSRDYKNHIKDLYDNGFFIGTRDAPANPAEVGTPEEICNYNFDSETYESSQELKGCVDAINRYRSSNQ